MLYVCNVEEAAAATGNAFSAGSRSAATRGRARIVVVSAAIEAEVAQLPEADRAEFLEGLGLHDSGLDRVIRAGYDLLGLITYFTVGPKETRAWTIVRGTKAPQAAAVIHNDFERGFIACETIAYDDYVACKGEAGAKEAGKMRVEGKEYVVQGRRRAAVPLQRVIAYSSFASSVISRSAPSTPGSSPSRPRPVPGTSRRRCPGTRACSTRCTAAIFQPRDFLLHGQRRVAMQAVGRMAGAAELKRGRHAEAAGMRGGDQFLRVGALAVTEPGRERIRRILQRRALRGQAAFAVLAAALPLGAGVPLDACHVAPPADAPCGRPDAGR